MFAARIAGLALAAYFAANSSAFADGTWHLYVPSKWDSHSPTQPNALSDLPKSPSRAFKGELVGIEPMYEPSGLPAGKQRFEPLTVVKPVDKSVPASRGSALKK